MVYWTLTLTQLPPGITDPDELVTNANFQAFIREEIQNGIDNGNLPGLPVNRNSVAVIQSNFDTSFYLFVLFSSKFCLKSHSKAVKVSRLNFKSS